MYKIVQDNKVVDVVRVPVFVRFLKTGHISITDRSSAQGLLGSDKRTVYNFERVTKPDFGVVTLQPVDSLEEFNQLVKLLEKGRQPTADLTLLEKAKANKIAELSNHCKNKIIDGFTLVINKRSQSFKLTAEDQLNLLSIENQLQAGVDTFIYHATNEPCTVYKRNDMVRIVRAFRAHTLYHTTYFNIAKQYIKTLEDITAINEFQYGTDVSTFSTDQKVRQILIRGGAFV